MATPFMCRVAELVDTREHPRPATVPSMPKAWGVGVDDQALLRSLAEQLVCEANAVLAETGERIDLEDDLGEELLGFTLRYRGRSAHIATRRVGGAAWAQFDGWGSRCSETVELDGPEALEDAIVLLVVGESTVPATKTPM